MDWKHMVFEYWGRTIDGLVVIRVIFMLVMR